MLFRTTLSLALLGSSCVLAIPFPDGTNHTLAHRAPRRGCHVPISSETIAKVDKEVRGSRIFQGKVAGDPYFFSPANIDVYWNVVVANETYEGGWIPPEQIAAQMQVLNQDYASTGLVFTAKLVTRIVNAVWFDEIVHGVDKTLQTDLKTKYRVGGPEVLNLYTVSFANDDTLGYATFPFQYASDPLDDGIILRYTSLPGGKAPYDLGKTLTHEAGHWLGLYHPFQGGCDGDGDGIDDTPPQLTDTSGCPASKDSCPGAGLDSIHNFMDYSDDSCVSEFTPGQIERLRTHTGYYRGIGITVESLKK